METQGLSQTTRLIRRKGVYHYRRRVPDAFVEMFGKREIHQSLETDNLTQAKRRRAVEDLKWDAQFEIARQRLNGGQSLPTGVAADLPSEQAIIRLVQDYVARTDERAQLGFLRDPPSNSEEQAEASRDAEIGLGILTKRNDPRADEMILSAGAKMLSSAQASLDDDAVLFSAFTEWVRRGLSELERRRLARTQDDHRHPFFDPMFDGRAPRNATFGEVADQFLAGTEEEATANGTSLKWVDKQRANVALLKEIVGAELAVSAVDYDACLRVRTVLSHLPTHRTKLYRRLSLDKAILRAERDGKALLSPITQQGYLATLNQILDLGLKKRLIVANPADGLKPLKKDGVAAEAKRLPFTAKQLGQFFDSSFYRECAQHPVPYRNDKVGWRFWLPLLCLFMGMRPNEACQMHADDVKQTETGTWYVDVVASADDDETASTVKRLKTAYSRRRIPVHPELIAIGFLEFSSERKDEGVRLFPSLKPDEYGSCSKYALKRFRDSFLPAAITMEPRQSFYSFRHNFRDALRAIDAPPDALQALGGWSQGRLVSDSYGEKSNPDYQCRFVRQIAFPGLKVNHLLVKAS